MGINRRRFLGVLAAAGALLRYPRVQADTAPQGVSILQGLTDETSAQFSIVVPIADKHSAVIEPVDPQHPIPNMNITFVSRSHSAYGVIKIQASGLVPDQPYKLKVYNSQNQLVDERDFHSLDLSFRKVRLALVSCAMDHLHRKDIWKQFATQRPEMVFFLGDSVYCDRKSMSQTVPLADPVMMWDRYVETRNKVSFYFQKKLTPVLATWDDHDFGGNNLGSKYPYIKESTEIFETFFAQAPGPSLVGGPGVARKFSAWGGDFFLLDGRSFRGEPKAPGASMLGSAQEAWLAGNLARRSTWLLNGSLFFGAYGTDFESFEGDYSQKFAELLNVIRSKGSLAAFASGDVHYSELMDVEPAQVGYKTFELVSSGIHSITFPSHHERYKNPRRREADSNHNFLMYEGGFADDVMEGEITCWGSSYDLFVGTVSIKRP